jgi:hypothetical protein
MNSEVQAESSVESGWLIETPGAPTPMYFGPSLSKVDHIDICDWTRNHFEAVRFSRRIDAEKALLMLRATRPGYLTSFVSEHQWG